MTDVKTILKNKRSNSLYFVQADHCVLEAIQLMCDNDLGCLMVVEKGELVGVFSERDYARKMVLQNRSAKGTKIFEIMSQNPIVVHPNTRIEECMNLMNDHNIRHLPVMDGKSIVGLVSIGDLVNQIIHEQGGIIEHLTSYIKAA
jgi:CBS domain-containing protein